MAKIQTTGQLRAFLANSMIALTEGKMDPITATGVTKMAAQINQSFHAESSNAATQANLGNTVSDYGTLPLEPNNS